jgi:hypothetical protein
MAKGEKYELVGLGIENGKLEIDKTLKYEKNVIVGCPFIIRYSR